MPTQTQLEAEEVLDGMKDVEPLTQEEVCFWYGIKPEDYPRWVQAALERELESINKLARAFRGRKDAESVALVRQIEARCTQLRGWIRDWGEIAQRGSR
jgi:hypothetical protein